MSRKPLNIGKEKWNPKKIDKDELKETCKMARYFLQQVETNAQRGSILVDLDYDELFSRIEKLYAIVDIGALAEDNAARRKVERELA